MSYDTWNRVHGRNPKGLSSAEWETRKNAQKIRRLNEAEEREFKAGRKAELKKLIEETGNPWATLDGEGGAA